MSISGRSYGSSFDGLVVPAIDIVHVLVNGSTTGYLHYILLCIYPQAALPLARHIHQIRRHGNSCDICMFRQLRTVISIYSPLVKLTKHFRLSCF
jgi:hypothetical protein